MIAHPPCTHLAVSGAKHFTKKISDGRQQNAIEFFMRLVNCEIPKIAIENPVGIMSTIYRKPDQIIQPFFFGDHAKKSTCLWLKNLPLLFYSTENTLFASCSLVKPVLLSLPGRNKFIDKSYSNAKHRYPGERSYLRSLTYPGIAAAMANQWSNLAFYEH
jgi:hypothetical protein